MSKELTPELSFKLFFASFPLSQGNRNLQWVYSLYFHNKNPEWRITEEIYDQTLDLATQRMERYFRRNQTSDVHKTTREIHMEDVNNRPHIYQNPALSPPQEKDVIPGAARQELVVMQSTFANPRQFSLSSILQKICDLTIHRDHRFLTDPAGRPGNNPRKDSWESYYRKYILNATNTGIVEYNEMFSEVRNYLSNPNDTSLGNNSVPVEINFNHDPLCQDIPTELFHIQQIWEAKHPGHHFTPNHLVHPEH